MNKNNILIMIGLLTTTGMLGGCAAYPNNLGIGAPSVAQTHSLKGHPFVVGNVTTSAHVQPTGKSSNWCLPNKLYDELLRHDLVDAFKYQKLGQGTGTPVKVNVKILWRAFRTNMGMKGSQMAVRVSYGHFTTTMPLRSLGSAWTLNEDPGWQRERRLIPTMSIVVAHAMKNVQDGHTYTHGFSWFSQSAIVHYVPIGYKVQRIKGVLYVMPPSQIEKVTGKTKQQLTQICNAHQ